MTRFIEFSDMLAPITDNMYFMKEYDDTLKVYMITITFDLDVRINEYPSAEIFQKESDRDKRWDEIQRILRGAE